MHQKSAAIVLQKSAMALLESAKGNGPGLEGYAGPLVLQDGGGAVNFSMT